MWHKFLATVFSVLSLFHAPTYTEVVDRAQASIVRITGVVETEEGQGHYVCTGFVYSANRVLTAAHCLGELMQADGQAVDNVVRADAAADLALIDVKTKKAPLTIRDTPIARFDVITPIGYAFGGTRLWANPHRVILVDYSPAPDSMLPGVLSEPGCIGGQSGGPMIDGAGLVVGIVQQTAKGTCYGVGSLLIRAFLLGVQ